MSIETEINRIKNNVSDALDSIEAKGVTIPQGANSNNLSPLIDMIQQGGDLPFTVIDMADEPKYSDIIINILHWYFRDEFQNERGAVYYNEETGYQGALFYITSSVPYTEIKDEDGWIENVEYDTERYSDYHVWPGITSGNSSEEPRSRSSYGAQSLLNQFVYIRIGWRTYLTDGTIVENESQLVDDLSLYSEFDIRLKLLSQPNTLVLYKYPDFPTDYVNIETSIESQPFDDTGDSYELPVYEGSPFSYWTNCSTTENTVDSIISYCFHRINDYNSNSCSGSLAFVEDWIPINGSVKLYDYDLVNSLIYYKYNMNAFLDDDGFWNVDSGTMDIISYKHACSFHIDLKTKQVTVTPYVTSGGGGGGTVTDEHINSLIDAKLGYVETALDNILYGEGDN